MAKYEESYRVCPACGTYEEVRINSIYCRECGKKMIERCQDCLEPIYYPTSRFCPCCGLEYVTHQKKDLK